jgi:hypothetical protein
LFIGERPFQLEQKYQYVLNSFKHRSFDLLFKKYPEATSLEYKHVVFRKPKCSATEISGVDTGSVRNVEK